MKDYLGDPVARRFDHLLALTAYGLLVISVFTLWVPALIAAAIAFTHRRESDWLTASHFRFQLTIFFVGVLTGAVGFIILLTAGGFAIGALWSLASAGEPLAALVTAGSLTLTGIALFCFGAVWTFVTSVWGAWRLATDRAIGQSAPRRSLDIR